MRITNGRIYFGGSNSRYRWLGQFRQTASHTDVVAALMPFETNHRISDCEYAGRERYFIYVKRGALADGSEGGSGLSARGRQESGRTRNAHCASLPKVTCSKSHEWVVSAGKASGGTLLCRQVLHPSRDNTALRCNPKAFTRDKWLSQGFGRL